MLSPSILYEANVFESKTISPSSVCFIINAELGSFLALFNTFVTIFLSIVPSSDNLTKSFNGILSNSG